MFKISQVFLPLHSINSIKNRAYWTLSQYAHLPSPDPVLRPPRTTVPSMAQVGSWSNSQKEAFPVFKSERSLEAI